ncbi:conserved protein of unknown function [Pararobbsia alpina]|uniref:hypothetical protein n=1 Tax=Pararobbsia alpina TaxID=621374 RepID=UPI0039A46403
MFQIEAREYRILWLGAHAYWALYEDGRLIGELHGLATDRKSGAARAIGSRRDQLKAWVFSSDGAASQHTSTRRGLSGFYHPGQPSRIVCESNGVDALRRWERVLVAAEALNDAHIEYRVSGGAGDDITTGNSNSAWRTFADVMGVQPVKLGAWLRPGDDKNVLPRETYAGLYDASVETCSLSGQPVGISREQRPSQAA